MSQFIPAAVRDAGTAVADLAVRLAPTAGGIAEARRLAAVHSAVVDGQRDQTARAAAMGGAR